MTIDLERRDHPIVVSSEQESTLGGDAPSPMQPLGDLGRLRLVLEYMPGEELMRNLHRQRGRGRNDYPVRAMWNSVLAGIVFQHGGVEKLRRELMRNAQQCEMCGLFDGQVPPPCAYTRFLHHVLKQAPQVDAIFDTLVQHLREALPGFGEHWAMDSKAIASFAKRKNPNDTVDGRRDTDADYGRKEYRGVHKDGRTWEKIVKWFAISYIWSSTRRMMLPSRKLP